MKRIAALSILLAGCASTGEIAPLVQQLIDARREGRPIPVLSQHADELPVATAYGVQKAYVSRRIDEQQDRVAGFKAGLTSAAGRKRFGLDAPVAGVLLAAGRVDPGTVVAITGSSRIMIETEIGFVVGRRIEHPLADTNDVRACVSAVFPAIEMPDLGYEDMSALTGADIIAANVSADRFIVGETIAVDRVSLAALEVALVQGGTVVHTGHGREAMGDPWTAALWLINRTVRNGWVIEPGHVLLSGALGGMAVAKPGSYTATFNGLGEVAFEIR